METTAPPATDERLARLPAILLACVDKDDRQSRYRLGTPWLAADGFVYATDGRIAARMPESLVDPEALAALREQDAGRASGRPKAGEVFIDHHDAEAIPAPAVTLEPPPCESCKGKGSTFEPDCDECNGRGYVTCEYDHDHQCPECDGRPGSGENVACRACAGTGLAVDERAIPIGKGLNLKAHQLHMLAGATLRLPTDTCSPESRRIVRFDLGPVEGRVMAAYESES